MNPTSAIDPGAVERLREWGGDALLAQMIRLFVTSGGERVEQIRNGVGDGEVREAEMGAHSLKSSAANLGAERVRAICAEMELAAGAGDLEAVRTRVADLDEAFGQAIRELEIIGEGIAV